MAAESQKAEEWLAGISAKLEGLAMTAEPPVKVSEVQAKTTALIDTCEPIVKTRARAVHMQGKGGCLPASRGWSTV